jgi:hypothetical protein
MLACAHDSNSPICDANMLDAAYIARSRLSLPEAFDDVCTPQLQRERHLLNAIRPHPLKRIALSKVQWSPIPYQNVNQTHGTAHSA